MAILQQAAIKYIRDHP